MQNVTAKPLQRNYRIQSIDLLRGLIMIIMALDHTRDYFHWPVFHYDPLDFSQTSTPIFLTRWITHFCAPVFVFLAGTSAWLTGLRKGKKVLSKFLFTRGLWLVFLELTIIGFGISFNWHFNFFFLQTIWALGISMVVLSFLIYLPKRILLILALLIIAGHNTLDNIHVEGNSIQSFAWSALHDPRLFKFGQFQIFVLYPVLAWIGVMAAGYCFGELYTRFNIDKRKKLLIIIGSACILFFIIIRWTNLYGDASHWSKQKIPVFTFLSFINTTKYPPSLLYILMTIGPAILFLAFMEKPLNRLGNIISIYGKVPMFYYVIHFYVLHFVSVIAGLLSGYSLHEMVEGGPGGQPLQNFGYKLGVVYLIWFTIVALLYPLCKRYAKYKFDHPEKWWLSYL